MTDRGPWLQTHSGLRYYPLAPRSEDVFLGDIAHSLSQICRYGGHSQHHYSVAQHSVLVSEEVFSAAALPALLHDAAEAYVGDWPRPLKHPGSFDPRGEAAAAWYRDVEERNMVAVYTAFGIPLPLTDDVADEIARVDTQILLDEADAVMGGQAFPWGIQGEPLGIPRIYPYASGVAETVFLARFRQLCR